MKLSYISIIALTGMLLAPARIDAQVNGERNTSGVKVPDAPTFSRDTPDRYGTQLAEYLDRFDSGWVDQYIASKLTLYDRRGDSIRRAITQMILEGDSGDKSIIRFKSPAEIKGVAALTHEHAAATDDNWLYLPATKRVRRISGANKTASFQGTEFTYEDLSRRVVQKYAWRFLSESNTTTEAGQTAAYKLEAIPSYKNTGYSRLLIYINKDRWRVERVEFYDKAQRLLKVRVNSNWRHVHGRFWRPYRVEMKNEQTQKRTVIEIKRLYLNLSLYKSKRTGRSRKNLTAKHFTTRALERR